MARLKKNANGYFRQTFTFEGKKYCVYAKEMHELIEKTAKKKAELKMGIENVYNPTLNKYYEEFTAKRKNEVKASTIRSQRSQFENIANVIMVNNITLGEMKIKNITRRDIETARNKLLEDNKTPQNLNNCFAHLNHVFNDAYINEVIEKNPCKALKQLKRIAPLIGENRHRALSVEETKVFMEKAEEIQSYYYNAFKLMLNTGIRIGELGALYSTDVDRTNDYIKIKRTIQRDEVGGYTIGDDAKTKSGVRDIPVKKDVINIIINQQRYNRFIFNDNTDGLLFRGVDGGILREYSINREIKRICKAAGIEYFTCHAFRNTFATRFIEQRGQDYKILSEILGHKDVSITLNLYTHVMDASKVNAMRALII